VQNCGIGEAAILPAIPRLGDDSLARQVPESATMKETPKMSYIVGLGVTEDEIEK
jgi:hypothetical protein